MALDAIFSEEMRSRWRYYLAPSAQEVKELFFATLAIGFLFSFRHWGSGDVFDLAVGLYNFFIITGLSAIAMFGRAFFQRIYGLTEGFRPEFKLWFTGLGTSLILVFITNGLIPLVLVGGSRSAFLMRHRMGEFRYGYNYWENGLIAMMGSVFNLVLALVSKLGLLIFPDNFFLKTFLLLNVVMAITMMLPIPPLDGMTLFYASRVTWVLFIGIALSIGVLLQFAGIILSILVGTLIGLLLWGLYYFSYET